MEKFIYIVIGPPGAGKSTLIKAHPHLNNISVVLSSDALRAQIGTGEEDQSVSAEVFSLMRAMSTYLLTQGKSVVIDATNTTRRSRADFVKIGRATGAKVFMIYLDLPLAVAIERNNSRERKVPQHVIERMFKQLEIPTKGEYDYFQHLVANGNNWNIHIEA